MSNILPGHPLTKPTSQRLRVCVVGLGYLGATQAICMASLGFDVIGVDIDERRVEHLRRGEVPFFEPGLQELLEAAQADGRIEFTTDIDHAVALGDIYFICVGTPQTKDSPAADLTFVESAFAAVASRITRKSLLVGKSTVPVGTAARMADLVASLSQVGSAVEVAWNPEFLREGFAVKDTLNPDRLVFGIASEWAHHQLSLVYAPLLERDTPLVVTDLATAELVKVAANAFLATKISFINAMAEVCEATGADVNDLAAALSHDTRIGGRSLKPGLGFGGGCLPKDIRAFAFHATEIGVGQAVSFLSDIDAINGRRRTRMADLVREMADGDLNGKRVAALGAAFKPNSDDVRDAPALEVARMLSLEGADVRVYDPVANGNAHRAYPDLRYAETMAEALDGADVVALLTEWAEFTAADPELLGRLVTLKRIVDGRNALDLDAYRKAGWEVRVLGRPPHRFYMQESAGEPKMTTRT